MMSELKTKMEEQLELFEDWVLQKELTSKVPNKEEDGIMEENNVTERQKEAEEEKQQDKERRDSFEYRFSIGYDYLHFERLFFKLDVAEVKRKPKEGCQQDSLISDWVDFTRKLTEANWGTVHIPKMAMSKKKRNMKHHGMLPMSVQTGRYVVQGGAQKERGKLIENPELSGKFDAEKEILELEQLLRCKVCLDSDACIVFFPCRHMATCENCEGFLHCCPVCRSFIEEAVKINEE